MTRAWLLAGLLACGPASSESASESESESESASASESESESESESPGDALAREVWRAAGGERLGEVAQLDFRFVVEDAGATVFEAAHRWDRRGDRDRVTWTDREGVVRDVRVGLGEEHDACGHIDGEPATGADLEALAEAGYARWVNDAYWLMLPLKVLDPGVTRTLLDGSPNARRLELTFDAVGLTPGDRYVLDIDDAHRVTRWDMFLEGAEPPPGGSAAQGVTFEAHTAVGPLTLPLDHAVEGEDADRRVLLRDVVAHDAVDPEAFVLRGCD